MRAMSPWVKAVVLAVVIAAAWWGLAAAGFDLRRWNPEQIRAFMLAQGAWAPVIYLAVFAQPLVPLPSSVMIMAGCANKRPSDTMKRPKMDPDFDCSKEEAVTAIEEKINSI